MNKIEIKEFIIEYLENFDGSLCTTDDVWTEIVNKYGNSDLDRLYDLYTECTEELESEGEIYTDIITEIGLN